jgi:pimeloyl-ACP methyl ester carboxylesterase
MGLVDTICHSLLRFHGFQYMKTTTTSLQVWPPRPATWLEPARSPTRNISYWIRPHTSRKRLPILYIHGIGVGLIPHVGFLHELDTALNGDNPDDGEVGILAIEILQISSRLTKAVMTREAFLDEITAILDYHHYDRFVMASHSYGSVLSTHVLTHQPLASRISATLLIDPVTILLHMPDVAYNFCVRPPKHANEWQLWYFASRDPSISHTLGRHFFWHQNLLWRDRIMELVRSGSRVTASLASKDLIVDTEAVGTYLSENQVPDPVIKQDGDRQQMELETAKASAGHWKQWPWRGDGLDVMWWEGLDHAQVFDNAASRGKLVDVLVEYSKGV